MKKLKVLSAEMVVATSAIIVSVCALYVSILEVRLMEQQKEEEKIYQRASVWPYVETGFVRESTNNEHNFSIQLTNNGVGLAKLKYLGIEYQGKTISNWDELIKKVDGDFHVKTMHSVGQLNTMFLPATHKTIFSVKSSRESIDKLQSDLTITSCYCSVYDECWASPASRKEEICRE